MTCSKSNYSLFTKMTNVNERKVALFVHGWFANALSCWGDLGNCKLPSMCKEMDYEVRFVNMPGMYMFPDNDKGFKYYAEFLAEEIKRISACPYCGSDCVKPSEIILIAHSMGGIACRLYLQDENIGNKDLKSRVRKMITIASPHHGTDPKIESIPKKIINGFIDMLEKIGGKIDFEYKELHRSKCYQELSIGSEFIRTLNKMSFPKQVEFHSIWTVGDLTVDPIHTAVSEYAQNYFIDKIYVTHLNILRSVHTIDIFSKILNCKPPPSIGLQKYPKECDCGVLNKQWIPTLFSRKDHKYSWKCINVQKYEKNGKELIKECLENHSQKWQPNITGCNVGLMDKRFHTWLITGKKHWTCQKCGTTVEDIKFPESYESNGCIKPFHNWHRWKLDWSEWKCKNCHEIKKSFRTPPSLGCKEGIYRGKRLHEWKKTHKIYKFNFECTGCKNEIITEVSLPL